MPSVGRIRQLFSFYYNQRVKGFEPPQDPHFDPESTPWFTERLSRASSYVEFGAGGSTLLAGRMGIPTVTVESDPYFARAVVKALSPSSKNKMIVVNIGLTELWGMPLLKKPIARRVARWAKYPAAPFDVIPENRFPDLVLVDGRFRVACALETVRKAEKLGKSCTVCVDDYYDDENPRNYDALEAYLGKPVMQGRMAVFENGARLRPVAEADVGRAAASLW